MERLLCFVPGLGIRACEPTGLVMTGPVSVARDGATLTVKNLLSTGTETTVQVEITGLPSAPSVSPQQVRLALRDERGTSYPPAPRVWAMGAGGAAVAGGFSQIFRGEAVFTALDPEARLAEVEVNGPDPIGLWRAQVPLTPVQEARLPAAQEAQATVTLHGITLRVASVLADHERTVVQLVATAEPPFRFVRSLGGNRFQRQLVLRDDQGREYAEIRTPGRTAPDQGGVHTDEIQFPPLAADARSADLVVPFMAVAEQTGEATLAVPVGGKQVGESIPLGATLMLGRYHLVVRDAAIVEQRGQRMLALRLDLGGWRDGRRLFGLERVLVDGQDRGYQFVVPDATSSVLELRVALPEQAADQVTIVLRDAQVAVDGPWRLPVALPGGR